MLCSELLVVHLALRYRSNERLRTIPTINSEEGNKNPLLFKHSIGLRFLGVWQPLVYDVMFSWNSLEYCQRGISSPSPCFSIRYLRSTSLWGPLPGIFRGKKERLTPEVQRDPCKRWDPRIRRHGLILHFLDAFLVTLYSSLDLTLLSLGHYFQTLQNNRNPWLSIYPPKMTPKIIFIEIILSSL